MQFQTAHGQIAVNVPTKAHLQTRVQAKFEEKQGFALATLNLDHLVKLSDSAPFFNAYDAQDLVVADGNPIVWLSRTAGHPVELMPGSELVIPLAEWAAAAGRSVALLGSTEEALAAAALVLERKVPGLKVVAQIAPPFGFDPDGSDAADMLRAVQASGAGLCFLALGAPKQETLAARGREFAPKVGFASIGAGLDFLAGTQARAPKWAQMIAMEWLWRLLSNPKRMWRRYMSCFAILPGHWRNARRMRQIDQ